MAGLGDLCFVSEGDLNYTMATLMCGNVFCKYLFRPIGSVGSQSHTTCDPESD